uniref:Uncharacterized protein n=1 Tax=Physcomitrium patens TaxID=3218 RepID=A0A2K1K1U1_PHYPA|nr:hypothetical protein PHYPA_012222 [Physcomitrium patens]
MFWHQGRHHQDILYANWRRCAICWFRIMQGFVRCCPRCQISSLHIIVVTGLSSVMIGLYPIYAILKVY